MSAAISRLWWLPLIRGILLLALGAYAMLRPGMTIDVLTKVLGIYLIAEGIMAIVAGVLREIPSRGWTIVRGIIEILVGLFVLGHSAFVGGITTTTLMYLLGIGAILAGIAEIVAAIQDRKAIEGEGWMMLGGALMIVFGVLLLIAPLAFGLLMVRLLGLFAVVYGISLISLAWRARSFGKELARSIARRAS